MRANEEGTLKAKSSRVAAEAADSVSSLFGRKLDALIAEQVLGWTRHPDTMHPTDNRTIGSVLYCRPEYPATNFGGELNCVPYYSTDIAAAMEVVDRLASDGWDITLRNPLILGIPRKWRCDLFRGNDSGPHESEMVVAETLPLAICRAALATEANNA